MAHTGPDLAKHKFKFKSTKAWHRFPHKGTKTIATLRGEPFVRWGTVMCHYSPRALICHRPEVGSKL